jgi:hypothetical protein
MRRFLMGLILLGSLSMVFADEGASGRVIKVLPLFLDLKGHDAVSPSLYDRDAYQAYLRQHPDQCSAMRIDVSWKASNTGNAELKLWVELRGIGQKGLPRQATLDQIVKPGGFFHRWTSVTLGGENYKNFGELVAWRVTLWAGDKMIGEQKSFLW